MLAQIRLPVNSYLRIWLSRILIIGSNDVREEWFSVGERRSAAKAAKTNPLFQRRGSETPSKKMTIGREEPC